MSSKAFAIRYAGGATVLVLVTLLVGVAVVQPAERVGVIAGAGAALLLQITSFWLLGIVLFPGRRLLVFGLGMAARVVLLLIAALVAGPLGLPLAPTLLTLVGVFLLTSLLEPLAFQSEMKRAR